VCSALILGLLRLDTISGSGGANVRITRLAEWIGAEVVISPGNRGWSIEVGAGRVAAHEKSGGASHHYTLEGTSLSQDTCGSKVVDFVV